MGLLAIRIDLGELTILPGPLAEESLDASSRVLDLQERPRDPAGIGRDAGQNLLRAGGEAEEPAGPRQHLDIGLIRDKSAASRNDLSLQRR